MITKLSTTLAALLVFAACSDGNGPTTGGTVSLTFAANANVAAGAAAPGRFVGPMASHEADPNTLVFTSVKVVLREIELESAEVADCDVEPEPAGCEDFEIGPLVIDLVLVDGVPTDPNIDITNIPFGTYDEIEFDIHKVSDSDATLSADLLAMAGQSIRVVGTWNDGVTTTEFIFETDLDEEQEQPLNLVIEAGGVTSTNVTINLDVNSWFKDGAGHLFNPATAAKGEPNEDLAKNNIKNSIDAFEDSDHDGHHDD